MYGVVVWSLGCETLCLYVGSDDLCFFLSGFLPVVFVVCVLYEIWVFVSLFLILNTGLDACVVRLCSFRSFC